MAHRQRPVVPHQHHRNVQPVQAYPSVAAPVRTGVPTRPAPYHLTGHHTGTILTVNTVRPRPQATIIPTGVPTRVATVVPRRPVVNGPVVRGHGGQHRGGHVHRH